LTVEDGTLAIGLPNPDDDVLIDVLRAATRLKIRPVPMARDAIREHLRVAYGDPAIVPRAVSDRSNDAPAVRAVDLVFAQAIGSHASDIHVEPTATGAGRVRFRVDGVLHEHDTISNVLFPSFVSRVKLLAGLDIADRRQPQDGRYAVPFEKRTIDARVSSIPTSDGEKLVIRLLDQYGAAPVLAHLGMPADILSRYREVAAAPWGFVVVTGPTGSGKTTTLYASLSELDVVGRNVCSVEDPVELRLAGVTQVQVNTRASVTFPLVLRSFMRQDPNVIMVGEMRDAETAAVALSAALAGQIVFTTLHANDAPRTIDRLVELGVARHSLAAALTAVVAQRLVRILCDHCRVREVIPSALQRSLEIAREEWFASRGCRACGGTGFLGRTGIYELLLVDDATRDAIANGSSSVQIAQTARDAGYRPMLQDAMAKVLAGVTTFAEVRRVLKWSPPS
jgi:type IV pilus assembly protein PilB